MDTTKHVVTIPIEDYNRLMIAENLLSEFEENLKAHLDMINQRQRHEIKIDISRKPIDVLSMGGSLEGYKTAFKY